MLHNPLSAVDTKVSICKGSAMSTNHKHDFFCIPVEYWRWFFLWLSSCM